MRHLSRLNDKQVLQLKLHGIQVSVLSSKTKPSKQVKQIDVLRLEHDLHEDGHTARTV